MNKTEGPSTANSQELERSGFRVAPTDILLQSYRLFMVAHVWEPRGLLTAAGGVEKGDIVLSG